MSLVGLIVVVASLSADPEEPLNTPVTISVTAVEATNEQPAAREAQERPHRFKELLKGGAGDTEPPFSKGYVAPLSRRAGKPEKRLDPELKSVETALAHLEYDTFRKVGSATDTVRLNEEAQFPLTSSYTLFVTPVSEDPEGRIRVEVRIEEKETRKDAAGREETVSRTALETTSALVPGKQLVLGGLRLKRGQLVVILTAEL